MALKRRRTEIETFKKQLIDDPTDDKHMDDEQTQLSGTLEIIDVHPDPVARVPQTKVAEAKFTQTQTQVDIPSKSDEKDSKETESIKPQMTRSNEEQSSKKGSKDRGDAESLVTLSSSLTSDANTY